jgi:hypothetical protein
VLSCSNFPIRYSFSVVRPSRRVRGTTFLALILYMLTVYETLLQISLKKTSWTTFFHLHCAFAKRLLTRQPVYLQHNTDVRLCNHRCSGKAVSVTYFECVFVALDNRHVKRLCPIIRHLRPV